MDLFIAIDPGKTCGIAVASMVPGGPFRLEAVAAVECACMSRPEETVQCVQTAVQQLRLRRVSSPSQAHAADDPDSSRSASKRVKLSIASVTIGVETQFSHPGSIRCEAWLSGALWSWSQSSFEHIPVFMRSISGQSRLKLPGFVRATPLKLPSASGVTKTQRRTIVKAHARALVDLVFREKPAVLDLDAVQPWYASLTNPVPARTKAKRVHDAVDAVLLMMVLAGQAVNASTRSKVEARHVVLPRFTSESRFCALDLVAAPIP